jgi:branched-chain amino acid transport system ATP-binding protein
VRSIMGLTPACAGSISFGGTEIRALPAYRVAKLGIGLVPEGRQVFPNLTTRENLIATAANRGGARDPWTLDKVCGLFPRLAERARSMANLLSGGEQQMLAMGRGLMQQPVVLMIDELSLGLAPVLAQQLFMTLKTLKGQGITIVLVEQNVHLALAISDYTYVFAEGRVPIEGESEQVASMDEVRRAYLGM